jgi:oxygen-independent coproporphyrinogen III oxidase
VLAYLHIPFCDSKCPYCAFNSYDNKSTLKKSYMQAITSQLSFELDKYTVEKRSITSLFIGGGTPSTIEPAEYEPFFKVLFPYLCLDAEITAEANPHSATRSWLEGMFALGVNRLSLGVQSFDTEKLLFLGRNHTREMALNAISQAATIGFKNLSLDLMYGTALDTLKRLKEDLHIASSLPINHLSAYALSLEEETPFFNRPKLTNTSETMAKQFVHAIITKGFPQYEISNFGTYQSLHNKGYWEGKNYLGIGSGAVGFLDNKRFYPSKEVEVYTQNPLAQSIERLSQEELHGEKIFLGLRSCVGVALSHFTPKELEKVRLLLREKKLTCKDERVYNNDYFISDEIALYLSLP